MVIRPLIDASAEPGNVPDRAPARAADPADGVQRLAQPLTAAASSTIGTSRSLPSESLPLERRGLVADLQDLVGKAEARIGDCQSAFTLPHWTMALIADDRSSPGDAAAPMTAVLHIATTMPVVGNMDNSSKVSPDRMMTGTR